MKRVAGWAALVVPSVALAAAAMVLGWRIAGPVESETELGRISFEVAADSFGEVNAYVPIADWGIRANAFDAPFELDLEVRSLNRKGALEAAGGERTAVTTVRENLESSAREAVLRGFGFALGTVLIVALVLWLLRFRFPSLRNAAVIVAATGAVGTAVSLALAVLTFNASAFSAPAYYGRGAELAQLLDFFERQQDNDRYTSTFDNALGNFSAYLADAPRVGEGGDRAIYVGSDLHSNVLILSALAGFISDEPFLIAGDLAISGSDEEAGAITPRVAELSNQVVAVSGNHDSALLMGALAEDGVEVVGTAGILDQDGTYESGEFLDVEGLQVAGFSDPLEWQGPDPSSSERIYSFPEFEDGDERLAEAKEDAVAWFDGLPEKPDIAMVHQNAIAQNLAATLADEGYSDPLTILTGHNHFQAIDRYAGGAINVVNSGTLGAGGPFRVGQESAGLGQLHYPNTDATLQSVDLIKIEPLSGQAQAERVILDVACPPAEAAEEPCHYEPG